MRWAISNYLTPPDPITSLEFPGGSMSLTLWRDCAFGAESNGQGLGGAPKRLFSLGRIVGLA